MPKVKEDRKKKLEDSDSSSDSGPDDKTPVTKKPKTESTATSSKKGGKDGNETTWEIGKKRFVTVREFKGQVYVDIREFYDNGGDLKPGKKGISLSTVQWQKLKSIITEVDEAVTNM